MGTNYYWKEKLDFIEDGIYNTFEKIHIGKSSSGWVFSLHVTYDIKNLDDWKKNFCIPGSFIFDEYDKIVSVEEMLKIITERKGNETKTLPNGYSSWDNFHARNHSLLGPNGLFRHEIGYYCSGHGEGTWDYVPGEFC